MTSSQATASSPEAPNSTTELTSSGEAFGVAQAGPTPVSEADLNQHIEQALADYFAERLDDCTDLDPSFAEAARQLRAFVLDGGKRIRPRFAWWGWRAAGGDSEGPDAAATLRAVSSLELIQACALMHDDLIDDSDTRRGQPTVHRHFAMEHHQRALAGDGDRFGMSLAILLGDLALVWADDMLHSAGLDPHALNRALSPWQGMRTEVLAGQYSDINGQARQDDDPRTALRVAELKSASYTVRRPLQLGAEIAGADPTVLRALGDFGTDIGIAFQLRDDLLGVFGDPTVTGKPAGDDLREGKRTLLTAETLERAHAQGRKQTERLVRHVLDTASPSADDVDAVCEAMVSLGAVEAIEDRITELTDTALGTLRSTDIPESAVTNLEELAIRATKRSR